MAGNKDREVLRTLAKKWMELANLPVMEERKRLWKAHNDLNGERPMIFIETISIENFVPESELQCEDPFYRNVENLMRDNIRHAEEVQDDIVIEPYFRIPWEISSSDYGVPIEPKPSKDSMGYIFNPVINSPEEVNKLKPRSYEVDRESTKYLQEKLEDVIGDILPIRVGGYDPFFGLEQLGTASSEVNLDKSGYPAFIGNCYLGLTIDLYKLIGNDNLLRWVYDEPETIHKIMQYLRDDRLAFFEWMKEEKLLEPNTDNQFAGPGSYGYVSDSKMAQPDHEGDLCLNNLWAWVESQETEMISPAMYSEFALPYLAELGQKFGLTYYACCERVDDRFEYIKDALPNLRKISVSMWNDFEKMGELLGNDYVYSRKPAPPPMSNKVEWDKAKKDIEETYQAAKDGNLEFIFRDLYDINGERDRLKRWVDMTRAITES